MQQPVEVVEVLLPERLVEPPLLVQLGDALAGVACTPSIVRAGSPGTRCSMKKQTSVQPKITGITCSRRLTM